MFITYEQPHPECAREVLATHETFYAAFNALKANPNCLFVEEDEDYPGEAADAYMAGGTIRSIEREGLVIDSSTYHKEEAQ